MIRTSLAVWFLALSLASAQDDPPHYIAITIPHLVRSEDVFVRYSLDGDFGGWVEPHADVSLYMIGTTRKGHAASRIKALLYAPGCAIQTLDLAIAGSQVQRAPFVCTPVGWHQIAGSFAAPVPRDLRIEVKYTAAWIQTFLGLGGGIVTGIPVATSIDRAGSGGFHLSIPDFSRDPGVGGGEFQFRAADLDSGKIIAQLRPMDRALRFTAPDMNHPAEVQFVVCGIPDARPHDAFGFAIRGKSDAEACRP